MISQPPVTTIVHFEIATDRRVSPTIGSTLSSSPNLPHNGRRCRGWPEAGLVSSATGVQVWYIQIEFLAHHAALSLIMMLVHADACCRCRNTALDLQNVGSKHLSRNDRPST